MVLWSYGYTRIAQTPAVVALLLLTMQRLARPVLTTPLAVTLALAAFTLVTARHVNVVSVVVGAGLIGIAVLRRLPK
jgi:chromate transport protein ChrA